ncbi:MAG: hypothetical protein LBU43_11050 [Candidatus Accumulibacter sp.]|jgi:hypothetical protein|nr:hypothetical protein [Accumulibacter sp.]
MAANDFFRARRDLVIDLTPLAVLVRRLPSRRPFVGYAHARQFKRLKQYRQTATTAAGLQQKLATGMKACR